MPDVSVVIPTSGTRDSVHRAIQSAEAQVDPPREIIVAQCGVGPDVVDPRGRVRLVRVPQMNGSAARMAGVRAAVAERIALLDDDDFWRPHHLAVADSLHGSSDVIVTSSRVLRRAPGSADRVMPETLYTGGNVGDYLFNRDGLRYGERLLHTSTLTFPRTLALDVPWDPQLPRHQDWDWVLRAQAIAGAKFAHSGVVTCEIEWSGFPSVSRSVAWQQSLAWTERVYADGLLNRASVASVRLYVTSDQAFLSGNRLAASRLAVRECKHRPRPILALSIWAARTARHALKGIQ